MENYYKKYIKYKNKYLKMKKSIKNNIIGGELLLNSYKADLVASDMLNDDYYLLDYHGSTDSNSYFIIPDNIILIVSNCCGAFNFAKENIYVNPLDSSSCPMITKEALVNSISDGNIRLGNNTYFVVKPGTEMCNINLTLKDNDDTCSGSFKKKFNQDILSYEVKKPLIKTKFIGLLDNFKNKPTALELIKNYKPNKILSECIIKSKIYLFLLIKFHRHLPVNEEFKLVDVEDIRKKLINFLEDIILMIDDETYDSELSSFTISEIDSELKPIKTRFNEFNNDNFLFSLFNKIIYDEFIKQEPTEIKLSEHLDKINSESPSDKKSFVFLYSCQSNSITCSLDHCYRKITFKKRFRSESFVRIEPFMDQIIKGIDRHSFIVTVNTSFHIKLKMIDKVFSEFGFINNSEVLYYLICMMYDFINNTNICNGYGIVLSNLVNNRCGWVRRDTIKNIYDYKNWKFLINAILINTNYTESFIYIFEEFIDIFIKHIPNIYELNLEEFLDLFHEKIDIFHNDLIEFVETYEIPKSLINEKNIEEFFNNIRLLDDQIRGLNYENLLQILDEEMINYFDFYVKANSGHKAKLNYVNINEVFISDELINVKKIILNELIYIDNRLDVLKNKIKVKVNVEVKHGLNGAW